MHDLPFHGDFHKQLYGLSGCKQESGHHTEDIFQFRHFQRQP